MLTDIRRCQGHLLCSGGVRDAEVVDKLFVKTSRLKKKQSDIVFGGCRTIASVEL